MDRRTQTLILLHVAVFLAGWTGIFGRIISLGGLPLVWYRSIIALAALGLLSAAVYSVFAILNIRVASDTGQDSATMLLYELVGSVLFLAVCMPVYVRLNPTLPAVPSQTDLWGLLALGSVFTIIPFLLQIHALRHLSAFTVNVAYNLEPVYSIVFAAILFGETREVGLSFWAGLALIIVSVVLQSRRSIAKQA